MERRGDEGWSGADEKGRGRGGVGKNVIKERSKRKKDYIDDKGDE